MKKLLKTRFSISFLFVLSFLLIIYAGCGGNNDGSIISNAINNEKILNVQEVDDGVITDKDDAFYAALEQRLNDELTVKSNAPNKCGGTGLTKVILNIVTEEVQTTGAYDLSKIAVTAFFADKTSEVVTPVWTIYSGAGTLNGTVYTSVAKPEVAVLLATYTENSISKLALFRLTVIGLTSITLNKLTDEIFLPANYNLATELVATAKYSNSATKVIIPVWTLSSGAGTLNDTIYTPAAKVETAVFTANYADSGISKSVQFKLKVSGLSSLILSKTTDEIKSCETYDLAAKIIVSNKLSNGAINDITTNMNTTWALASGSGALVGTTYTAPAKAETAVFNIGYAEAGITKTTQFRLKVVGLNSVTFYDRETSKCVTTDEVTASAQYDFALKTVVMANFSDGSSKEVTVTPNTVWTLTSGTGTLNGTNYTAPAKVETSVITVSYVESGVTKSAQFRLKISGLSTLTLNKVTDEIMLPSTYDLAGEIIATAKMSDGSIKSVVPSWTITSGAGTLSGTVYNPFAKPETAIFTAAYTENGITKTAQIYLKVIGLSSLCLSQTTGEVVSCGVFNLANITITDKLSNGSVKDITSDPNLKWTFTSGAGTLSNTEYTAPAKAETAVFTASYNEGGIIKSVNFRLKVIALTSVVLSKQTDETQVLSPYNLSSNEIIVAKFSNGSTKTVTFDPNLKWTLSFGSGELIGSIYTPAERPETAVLVATYVENGVTQSAQFKLKTVAPPSAIKLILSNLIVSKTTDSIEISGIYDLNALIVTAKYSNNTTGPVIPNWIITTGGGSIANNVFTAPDNAATVKLMGTVEAGDGSVRSVYFTIFVSDFKNTTITAAGGNVSLSNGITLEIPSNAVEGSTEISLSYTVDQKYNGIIIDLKNSASINKECFLKIPVNKTVSADRIFANCVFGSSQDFQRLTVEIELNNNRAPRAPSRMAGVSRSGMTPLGSYLSIGGVAEAMGALITLKLEPYMLKSFSASTKQIAINYYDLSYSIRNDEKIIAVPYYRQYGETCSPTTLLMMLKSYNKNSDWTIYKILKQIGISKGWPAYKSKFSSNVFSVFFEYSDQAQAAFELLSSQTGNTVATFHNEDHGYSEYFDKIIESIDKGSPVNHNYFVQTNFQLSWNPIRIIEHSVVIYGYKKNNPNDSSPESLSLFVHNPDKKPCEILTYAEFKEKYWSKYDAFLVIPSNPSPNNASLQTIHIPSKINLGFGIKCKYNIDSFDFVVWDYQSQNGYNFATDLKSSNEIILPEKFIELSFNEIPILNSSPNTLAGEFIKIEVISIDKNGNRMADLITSRTDLPPLFSLYGKSLVDVAEYNNDNKYYFQAYSLSGDLFRQKIREKNITDTYYKINIDLCDASGNKLDGFDFKFKYIPPKLSLKITPENPILTNNNMFKFTALVDGETTETGVTWQVEDGATFTNGEFTPTKWGTYTIKASYSAANLETTTVVIVNPLTLTVSPASATIYVGESKKFNAIADGFTAEAGLTWSGTGIDGNGNFTAPGQPGNYTIKAEFMGLEATATITVKTHELKIDPPNAMLNLNQQFKFNAIYDGETKETGITWSATGGAINASGNGLYTAPNQWGTYTITAVCGNLNTSAVVIVNDERIRLALYSNTPTVKMNSYQIASVQSATNNSMLTIRLSGANTATLNLSTTSGGRFELTGSSGNSYPEPKPWNQEFYYKYYPPAPDRPIYDSDETCHVTVTCAENTKTSVNFDVLINKPVQGTVETYFIRDSNAAYIYGGYTLGGGVWVSENPILKGVANKAQRYQVAKYTTGERIYYHGTYKGWNNDTNNTFGSNGEYYCNQSTGTSASYNSDGRKTYLYVFNPNFLEYTLTSWTYTVDVYHQPYPPITIYYDRRYTRTSLTAAWQQVYTGSNQQSSGWPPPDIINPVE